MSNYLAIATVTETLKALISQALQTVPKLSAAPQVRTDRPERAEPGFVGANLFLYQVTPNASLRNEDLATRRSDGTTIQRPQIALDLHYLISFHGKTTQQEPQRLLGKTVTILHALPILTSEQVRAVIRTAGNNSFLADSDLEHQLISVKFVPSRLNLEELSKLWTVFFQVPYDLSIAYEGTAVLMEADLSPQKALLAQAANFTSLPQLAPQIETIIPAFVEVPEPNQTTPLTIRGQNLLGEGVRVKIGDRDYAVQQNSGDLIVRLPSDLRAGLNPVQTIYPTSATPQLTSNIASFIVLPRITSEIDFTSRPNNTTGTLVRSIALEIMPELQPNQQAELILNKLFNEPQSRNARGYSFTTIITQTTNRLEFQIPASTMVEPGTYLVRVQIDRLQYAESRLTIDPQTRRYVSPVVQIP